MKLVEEPDMSAVAALRARLADGPLPLVDVAAELDAIRPALRQHIVSLVSSVVTQADEIWMAFLQAPDGKVTLRKRHIKAYSFEFGPLVLCVVSAPPEGIPNAEAWDVVDLLLDSDLSSPKLRSGRLLYPHADEQ